MKGRNAYSRSSLAVRRADFVTRFCYVLTLLACSFAFAITTFPQTKNEPPSKNTRHEDIVRVETRLVTVPVNVVDRQGRFLTKLKEAQFRIFEDGAEQQVAYFDDGDKPVVVALVLDISDSAKFKLADIQDAAVNFIRKLRTEDKVLIVAFDRQIRVLSTVTNDRDELLKAIGNIRSGAGTSVYNAVYTVLHQFLDAISGRKAVVLFSDGVDTTSLGATYTSTLELANESNGPIYVIKYDTYLDATENARNSALSQEQMTMRIGTEPARTVYERANRYLAQLAEATGGYVFEAGSGNQLPRAFDQIIQQLREHYSIGFYPKDDSKKGRRQLSVRVSIPGAKVRWRKYYVLIPTNGK